MSWRGCMIFKKLSDLIITLTYVLMDNFVLAFLRLKNSSYAKQIAIDKHKD